MSGKWAITLPSEEAETRRASVVQYRFCREPDWHGRRSRIPAAAGRGQLSSRGARESVGFKRRLVCSGTVYRQMQAIHYEAWKAMP
jgi:hypothetical protein